MCLEHGRYSGFGMDDLVTDTSKQLPALHSICLRTEVLLHGRREAKSVAPHDGNSKQHCDPPKAAAEQELFDIRQTPPIDPPTALTTSSYPYFYFYYYYHQHYYYYYYYYLLLLL